MKLEEILEKKLSQVTVKEILFAIHAYLEHREAVDDDDLTPEQKADLDDFIKRYTGQSR